MKIDAVRLTRLLHQYQDVIDALLEERRAGILPLSTSHLAATLDAYERTLITRALQDHRSVKQAARALGVKRTTLIARIRRLNIPTRGRG